MDWVDAVPFPTGDGPRSIEQLVEGGELVCAAGSCFLGRRSFPLSYWHGRFPLSDLLTRPYGLAAALMPGAGLEGLDLSNSLFLDIETTGLGRGGGTLVFLVGIGYFDNGFHLEQYLMRHPAEELALLEAVSRRLAGSAGLVTFNGRSFDWPMLAHRFANRGLVVPWVPAHLDLLLPARRHWRGRLPSCSLGSLEYHILRIERQDDIPSQLVPRLYWKYLQTGDGRLLQPVLEHNVTDILTMVTLTSHLGDLVEAGEL